MNQSRLIKNYQIAFKLLVLNTCQNPNPGDAKQEKNLFLPSIPVPSKILSTTLRPYGAYALRVCI